MKENIKRVLEGFKLGRTLIQFWRVCKIILQPNSNVIAWSDTLCAEEKAVLSDKMQNLIHKNFLSISCESGKLKFYYDNYLTLLRAQTLLTKEPETIDWLNSFQSDACLWDIGANVGLYSCYAAKIKGCNVFAFEPSILNLELLGKNIYLNELQDSVHLVPVALSSKNGFSTFLMTETAHGGADSTFGAGIGFDGKPIYESKLSYSLLGLSGDSLLAATGMPCPNHIKIDVDGIEHIVLAGMKGILKMPNVKSCLIEANDAYAAQVDGITQIMHECGFVLKEKKHSKLFNTGKYSSVYNQIWER